MSLRVHCVCVLVWVETAARQGQEHYLQHNAASAAALFASNKLAAAGQGKQNKVRIGTALPGHAGQLCAHAVMCCTSSSYSSELNEPAATTLLLYVQSIPVSH
jgi:hypothetical protein